MLRKERIGHGDILNTTTRILFVQIMHNAFLHINYVVFVIKSKDFLSPLKKNK